MDRKAFLKYASFITLGSLALSSCESEANESDTFEEIDYTRRFKWKMVTTWPPNFPILNEGCKLMADWVRRMSGGRLDIAVYGGGELVPALETFEAVSLGAVDMGNGASYYWAGKIPSAPFFSSVPFGLNAQQMNTWLFAGNGMDLWREIYEPFDLIPIPSGNTGVQMGGWFNKAINSIDDFRGLKMRIPGLAGEVIKRIGGTQMLTPGGEIYTNLERGVIDATEFIGPYHDYLMGFHEIAAYYYYPGWHETGTVLETIINKRKFQRLPPDLREILITASQLQNLWTLSQFEKRNAEYLEKIRNESSAEIRSFPMEVIRKLREIATDVLEDLASKDEMSNRILADMQSFKAQQIAWGKMTEESYFDLFK